MTRRDGTTGRQKAAREAESWQRPAFRNEEPRTDETLHCEGFEETPTVDAAATAVVMAPSCLSSRHELSDAVLSLLSLQNCALTSGNAGSQETDSSEGMTITMRRMRSTQRDDGTIQIP